MRVDSNNPFEPFVVGDAGAKARPAKAAKGEFVSDAPMGEFGALAQAAGQSPDVDAQKVAQARALLEAGQLESPEAFERAAANLLAMDE